LVIEDDQDIRDTLADVLQGEGYEVVLASNGSEGLNVLRDGRGAPCCVLLDLMMPIMDGWQFLEALRADARLECLNVVVMTGARGACDPAGAVRCLRKPVSVDSILHVMSEFCCGTSETAET
jgi:CheY-like chemotaxis protein